jgi:hypothetical protein
MYREGAFARANTGAHFNWFTGQLLSGRTVVIRSHEDIPQRRLLPPNTIAALVFARSFSFRCLLVVASSLRSALARSTRPGGPQWVSLGKVRD